MQLTTRNQLEELVAGHPPSMDAGIFGATIPVEDASLVLIPVTWEATVSYRRGTARGPRAILQASHQLDLFDLTFNLPVLAGITMLTNDQDAWQLNEVARSQAKKVILGAESKHPHDYDRWLANVNAASEKVNARVYKLALEHLNAGRSVAVVGGDHSSPFGLMQALVEKHPNFGILHFDAHFDLREAYEGFIHSHASIMYNALTRFGIKKLVPVGIRDFSLPEKKFAESLGERVNTFYGWDIFRRLANGETFAAISAEIVATLPKEVYISFDIDGLDPAFCPSTGTPVPGGLSFEQAVFIIEAVVASGRRVIGFDLCEVAPAEKDEWDANVGARILYKLCGALLRSRGKC